MCTYIELIVISTYFIFQTLTDKAKILIKLLCNKNIKFTDIK